MADPEVHTATTSPISSEIKSNSEFMQLEMKDGDACTVNIDSQDSQTGETNAAENDLKTIPTGEAGFDGSAAENIRREKPLEWRHNDRESNPLLPITSLKRLPEQTKTVSSTPSEGISLYKKVEIEPKPKSQHGQRKLEGTRIRISQLEKELVHVTKTASQSENQLRRMTATLSKVENQLLQNNKSLLVTEANLQASQSECKALRLKLEDVLENLRQTQNQVLRLQPKQQSITQSDALVAYTAICDNVEYWIGFHLDRALSEGRIDLTYDKTSASKLVKLLTPSGRKGTQYVDTDEYNLIAVVMEFLRCQIFEKDFYGALEAKHLEYVGLIMRNMESLTPRRDLECRRAWRSETLGALVNSPDFDLRQKTRIHVLADELLHILGVIDLAILNEKCFASLAINIIEPAVHLAHQLHLSMDRFRVQWSQHGQLTPPERSRDLSILESYECINLLGNGKAVRLEGRERASRDVPYLFDIVPGFYCQTFKEDIISDLRVLRKPKVLVAVAKPGRFGSQVVPLARKTGTILGGVYDKTRSWKV